jgi:hypothetical protein
MEGLLHTYDYAIDVWLLWPPNVARLAHETS